MTETVPQAKYDAVVDKGKRYRKACEQMIRTIRHKRGLFVAAELRASLAYKDMRALLDE